MRRNVSLLALTLVLLAHPAAWAFEVGAKAAYWLPKFSGEFRLDGSGLRGTTVDASDHLGIDDENFFFGEAWLWVGRHHLTLAGMRVDYSGSKVLSEEIVFGGRTFSASGRAESSLEYTMLDLAYQYDLIDLENVLAGFSLGPILQVKYLDGELRMSGEGSVNGAGGRVSVTESFQFPIPLVGLGAHVGLVGGWVEARGRAVGIAYQGDALWEVQAEVALTPFPFLEVLGGYRHFVIDVDRDDVLLDYTQTGPYVGAAVVF
ncbi:MAG: hypothetical protein AB1578_20775 [Thermodesulfobacteriota bacterium]|jgi:hypothetical protein